jgi:hypothetical protein
VASRGVSLADARKVLRKLDNVVEGLSYGMPSFLVNGRFFARFRDDDTVLVLQIKAISDRDVLMDIDPRAFFFTDHYRSSPAVLVRLKEVPPSLFEDVVREAWRHVSSLPPARRRTNPARHPRRMPRKPKLN